MSGISPSDPPLPYPRAGPGYAPSPITAPGIFAETPSPTTKPTTSLLRKNIGFTVALIVSVILATLILNGIVTYFLYKKLKKDWTRNQTMISSNNPRQMPSPATLDSRIINVNSNSNDNNNNANTNSNRLLTENDLSEGGIFGIRFCNESLRTIPSAPPPRLIIEDLLSSPLPIPSPSSQNNYLCQEQRHEDERSQEQPPNYNQSQLFTPQPIPPSLSPPQPTLYPLILPPQQQLQLQLQRQQQQQTNLQLPTPSSPPYSMFETRQSDYLSANQLVDMPVSFYSIDNKLN